MMVDKQSQQSSLAFHKDFRGFYSPPVPYKDQVFVYTYPDHYHISQDTLIELIHVLTETVLAVDTAEELIFIYDILNRRLSVEQQSQRSTGLSLPQKPDKIVWQKASTSLSLPPALAYQIKVYPNPSPSFLHLELPGSSYWQLGLYDVGGRLIAERQTQGTSRIDWALPEGLPNMILLKIEDGDGRQTSRIIKIVP
ncbi:MAG: T9SS type A sorting domain-containing protein [Bacteroidota bacterium]